MRSIHSFLKRETDHFLLYQGSEEETQLKGDMNALSLLSQGELSRYLLQVWIGKRHATVHGSHLTLAAAKKAVHAARLAEPKEYFYGLPEKKPRSAYSFKRRLDPFFKKDPAILVELAQRMQDAGKDEQVDAAFFSVGTAKRTEHITTSEGVQVADGVSLFSASVNSISKDATSTYWDGMTSPFSFDVEKLARDVRQKVHDFMYPRPVTAAMKKLPITLSTEVLANLLEAAFIENFNGLNYEKEKSILKNKMGQELYGSITLVDDGLLQEGVAAGKSDYEGTPKQQTTLIDKGVAKQLIYDYNTAKHAKTISTGNADATGINFSDITLTGPYNPPDKHIVIDTIMGAHTANALTTDFSVKAEKAYYVHGDTKIPLKSFMISGKMQDVLKKVVSIDKERLYRNGLLSGALTTKAISLIN